MTSSRDIAATKKKLYFLSDMNVIELWIKVTNHETKTRQVKHAF